MYQDDLESPLEDHHTQHLRNHTKLKLLLQHPSPIYWWVALLTTNLKDQLKIDIDEIDDDEYNII